MLNDPHVYIVIPLCRHTRINAFILVVANDCLPQKRLVSCQQHLQLFRHMKILQLADLAVCRTLCHTSIRRFWNNIIRPSKGRFYSPGPVPKRVPHVLCLFSGLFGRWETWWSECRLHTALESWSWMGTVEGTVEITSHHIIQHGSWSWFSHSFLEILGATK